MDDAIRLAERNKDYDALFIAMRRGGEDPKDYIENKIDELVKDLAELIRSNFRADKELWQQVPYLAWDSDGRTGWNSEYQQIYTTGYYRMSCSGRDIVVDCATGELYHWTTTRSVSNEKIIELVRSHDIHADTVIKYFLALAKNKISSVISPRDDSYHSKMPAKVFVRAG